MAKASPFKREDDATKIRTLTCSHDSTNPSSVHQDRNLRSTSRAMLLNDVCQEWTSDLDVAEGCASHCTLSCCSPPNRTEKSCKTRIAEALWDISSDDIYEDEMDEITETLQQSFTEKANNERKVHFSSQDPQVFPVLLRTDYTEDEYLATWYQQEDYLEIAQNCCKQIRKMSKGVKLLSKKYCSRGLESHLPRASVAKKKIREEAVNAVLDEQDYQQHEGFNDEEIIAAIYEAFSSSSQLWANRVALSDQRTAEEILDL